MKSFKTINFVRMLWRKNKKYLNNQYLTEEKSEQMLGEFEVRQNQ